MWAILSDHFNLIYTWIFIAATSTSPFVWIIYFVVRMRRVQMTVNARTHNLRHGLAWKARLENLTSFTTHDTSTSGSTAITQEASTRYLAARLRSKSEQLLKWLFPYK